MNPRRLLAPAALLALVATMTPGAVTTANATAEDRPLPLLGPATAPAKPLGAAPAADQRSRFVRLDTRALTGAELGDRFAIEPFEGESFNGVVQDIESTPEATTWTGSLTGGGYFVAARVDDAVHLSVVTDDGGYDVTKVGPGVYRAVESATFNPTADDGVEPPPITESAGRDRSTAPSPATAAPVRGDRDADAGNVIDVLFAATATGIAEAGGVDALGAKMNAGVAQTNAAFANSGLGLSLRSVGLVGTATTEVGGGLTTDIRRLQNPSDGFFDDVMVPRDAAHADLVSLWVGGPVSTTCGLGYIGTAPRSDIGFTVLFQSCDTATYRTFAHEIGHNLGADHDPEAPPTTASRPFARGYLDFEARWKTIMAYGEACVSRGFNCSEIPHFSNPAVTYNGRPTGTAAANNAAAIAEVGATVANYRQEQIYPGAISIVGEARFGKTAKASSTAWAPGDVSLGFQWFLDGQPVPGATGSSFKLKKGHVKKTLSLLVTGAAPYYNPVSAASGGVVVAKALFKSRKPKLKGIAKVGRVLSVSLKGWKPKPAKKSVKVKYQWERNGKKIKGAKSPRYRLTPKDRGKKISVVVKARKKGYETEKRSSKKVKVKRR